MHKRGPRLRPSLQVFMDEFDIEPMAARRFQSLCPRSLATASRVEVV